MHIHKPDWHTLGTHIGHTIHDPRFWVGFALVTLYALMIVMMILSKPGSGTIRNPVSPIYPYIP
jgi:hypothetical protein